MDKKWDFKGWATRHDVLCGDGRTIKESAFKHNNNQKVPLVWNHNHKDADNVLGHALLEHRKEGVYAYGKFNNTSQGRNAKELVEHGDVNSLSIYANKLTEINKAVIHGEIREVSLVLAGANPGAKIESVLAHGEGSETIGAIIWNNADLELSHSEDDESSTITPEETVEDKTANPDDSSNSKEDQKDLEDLKDPEDKKEEIKHSKEGDKTMEDNKLEHKDKTIQEVFDTLNEEQKLMVYGMLAALQEEYSEKDQKEDGGDKDMKQNAFDNETDNKQEGAVLAHSEFEKALKTARTNGSLKDAFIAHGIEDIEVLFPEVQALNKTPELISRDVDWVSTVMSGVSKSPFARVKSTAANITADEARAKGYVKGNQKVEEVITALKRTTTPQTVYKLQKLDRDDIIDITDFDVVVFIKAEMRTMLNEELARAFLIGDGRSGASADKINPLNIRPIYGDDPVYTVTRVLTPGAQDSAAKKAKDLISDTIRARKFYKGSGNPTFFTTEDELTEMLLIEDTNGRRIYDDISKLKTAMRVADIVTVPVMEGVHRVNGEDQYDLRGILVNLKDYNVGADKGGQVAMFEDFDLNFNKHEYLIETRCSGALKKPYSAIVFEGKGSVVSG